MWAGSRKWSSKSQVLRVMVVTFVFVQVMTLMVHVGGNQLLMIWSELIIASKIIILLSCQYNCLREVNLNGVSCPFFYSHSVCWIWGESPHTVDHHLSWRSLWIPWGNLAHQGDLDEQAKQATTSSSQTTVNISAQLVFIKPSLKLITLSWVTDTSWCWCSVCEVWVWNYICAGRNIAYGYDHTGPSTVPVMPTRS